jgi:hypothetical protein
MNQQFAVTNLSELKRGLLDSYRPPYGQHGPALRLCRHLTIYPLTADVGHLDCGNESYFLPIRTYSLFKFVE